MTQTKPPSDTQYRDMIFAKLLKIEDGVQVLNKESKYYEQYVQAVKEGIDMGIPQANKKVIEFNSDYTSVFIKPCFVGFFPSTWLRKVKQDIKK